jgi:peptidyl-prolyl cis-trans isomerase B (cyclophilin B)
MKWALLLSVLVAACATGGTRSEKLTGERGRIAQLEDARWSGGGELEKLAEHAQPEIRVRAVRALGRMPWPEEGAEITRALLERLFDADANVRAEAAFALGTRGDASAGDKLVFVALDHHEADRDPLVRARAVEALSKLERPDLHERLLDALNDGDARVRLEVFQGASRWPATAPNAGAIDQRLVAQLRSERDSNVRTYALFALDRRKSIEARDEFLFALLSTEVEQRIYAARGLKAIVARAAETADRSVELPKFDGRDAAVIAALAAATGDPDWRVAAEACVSLGEAPVNLTPPALAPLLANPNHHIAASATQALARALRFRAEEAHAFVLLGLIRSKLPAHRSASVRTAGVDLDAQVQCSIQANGCFVTTPENSQLLKRWLEPPTDDDGYVRAAAARNMAVVAAASPTIERDLRRLLVDSDLRVVAAAVEGLAMLKTPDARKLLRFACEHPDNGVRLAAVTELAKEPQAEDLPALVPCFRSTDGDGTPEVRFNVLKALAKLGGDDAKALAQHALFDDNAFVRKVARETFAQLAKDAPETPALLEQSRAHRSDAELRRRAAPIALVPHASELRVVVATTRGDLLFELFPEEAPLHVDNFLRLVERGYYDGLTFHRVVPDFVVQGGCYRGDGNGGGTWRGREEALRHEITPRKYVRGSLGMPRYDDIDSGGSQFFVTHRSTPHLDGRYTIFGELREGFDVLDALDVGDKILAVRVRSD